MLPIALLLSAALAMSPADARAIAAVELARGPATALLPHARSGDPATRARAARALGRLRSSGSLAPLQDLLRDEDEEVRAEAAFALGLVPGSAPALLRALDAEPAERVRARILESLGRQGGPEVVDALLAELRRPPRPLRPPRAGAAAARALGRLALRDSLGERAPEVADALVEQLRRLDRELRRGAAYALARVRPARLARPADLARAAAADPDPVVRAFLVRAAVRLPEATRQGLLERAAQDPAPAVRVAAARVAAEAGWTGVAGLLADEDPGVRRLAAQAVGALDALDREALLRPLVDAGATLEARESSLRGRDARVAVAAEAARALARAGLLGDADSLVDPARPAAVRAAAVEAIADPERLAALARDDLDPPVRSAAATALLREHPDRARDLLDAPDPVVAALAAEALADAPDRRAHAALVRALLDRKDAELRAWAARALHALYRDPRGPEPEAALAPALPELAASPHLGLRAAVRELARDLGVRLPPPPSPDPRVDEALAIRSARILTERGEVVIDLLPEIAPEAVLNFARLADSGFFDGNRCHRVEPDFVVQCGDPRGDGYGGPGWTIPDEPSPLRYDRGTIGMALSGPDTGGSQWFVTLSPQPHLDGSYTAFGRVVRGMRAWRAMLPGDRIVRVVVERAEPSSR